MRGDRERFVTRPQRREGIAPDARVDILDGDPGDRVRGKELGTESLRDPRRLFEDGQDGRSVEQVSPEFDSRSAAVHTVAREHERRDGGARLGIEQRDQRTDSSAHLHRLVEGCFARLEVGAREGLQQPRADVLAREVDLRIDAQGEHARVRDARLAGGALVVLDLDGHATVLTDQATTVEHASGHVVEAEVAGERDHGRRSCLRCDVRPDRAGRDHRREHERPQQIHQLASSGDAGGAWPWSAFTANHAMATTAHPSPTTTPASMMPRHGCANRRTTTTSPITPSVTPQAIARRFRVAPKYAMQKSGASATRAGVGSAASACARATIRGLHWRWNTR